ncbi:hypothetical protein M569_02530 [Genlisea aurea]|uniref:Uncharacterized protein n=1 Tax=Genlisea aurea TaxID=192259 RepID=S8EHP4_9LAMI|nr:hypothetical protein M569_02530 [Genlisea aurea]
MALVFSAPTIVVFNGMRTRCPSTSRRTCFSSSPVRCAGQSGLLRVIQTVWKVGRSGIEGGTNLVPDAIPRPIARISVTVVVLALALFVLKSFLSTLFFALAVMGLSYFAFLALNKDEVGPKEKSTSVEDSLEEARKIMEKYK